MLQESLKKIKFLGAYLTRKDIYACLTIIVVGVGGFFIGSLWGRETFRPPVTIKTVDLGQNTASQSQGAAVVQSNPAVENSSATAQYVGNKNSDIYELTTCAAAKLISDANKVFFATKADAESAGYRPAANCKM